MLDNMISTAKSILCNEIPG